MAPTPEEKRRMRIARKKRKKLQRREERKAKLTGKYSQELEVAIRAVNDEASHHKQLASKYYTLWRKCAKQNKEIKSQLVLGKQYGKVGAIFIYFIIFVELIINVAI